MSYIRWTTSALLGGLVLACFAQAPAKKGQTAVSKKDYGKTADGAPVDLYTLTGASGMKAEIITYDVSTKYRHAGSEERQTIRESVQSTCDRLPHGQERSRVQDILERIRGLAV